MNTAPEPIPKIEGCTPEKKTISILRANILAIVLFIFMGGILFFIYCMIWTGSGSFSLHRGLLMPALLLASILVGVVIHELIHGLVWIWVTHSGFSHLKFGAIAGAVYCHINLPMRKKSYVVGALAPLVIMGLIPMVIAFLIGNIYLFLFALIFIVSAIGDMMIVWAIRKEPADALVYDHPTEGGCYVYRPNSQSPNHIA